MYFLRKVIAGFLPKKKYHVFRKRSTILSDNTRKIMSRRSPFSKDLLFGGPGENIIFPCISFWKISSFIFCLRLRSYFREREAWSFSIIRERSYYSAIFLERTSFQDVWKKKIWFSVQWLDMPLLELASVTNQKVLYLVLWVKFWLSCLFL